MTPSDILAKLLEHNDWANRTIIRACAALDDDQLDARPQSAEHWSIRENVVHLVECQQGYLNLLTRARGEPGSGSSFPELEESARSTGVRLREIARSEDECSRHFAAPVESSDRYRFEPWVLMVQVINHATEHRKQIRHLMQLLGIDAPKLDGWSFGEAVDAVAPLPE